MGLTSASLDAQDESDWRRRRMQTGGLLSNKKRILVLGALVFGVLAFAGGASASGIGGSSPEDLTFASGYVDSDHRHPGKVIMTNAKNPAKHNSKKLKQTKGHSNKAICATPECAETAATIIDYMDATADPCVDFFQFACGGWYEKNPVTNVSKGTFYAADDLVQSRLQIILDTPAEPTDPAPLQDMHTLYDACLDTDTMNSLGLSPLITQFGPQGGWPMTLTNWDETKFNFEEALVNVLRLGYGVIVSYATAPDFVNTSRKIIYADEGGLGLSSTYLLNPGTYQAEINNYKKYISDSAKLVRNSVDSAVEDSIIDLEVDDLVNFEMALAQTMVLNPQNLSDVLAKSDITGLQALTDSETPGQFDWLRFFQLVFRGTDIVINADEPLYIFDDLFFAPFSTLLSTTSDRTLANYIGWWFTKITGSETTYAMRNVVDTYNQNQFGSAPSTNRQGDCRDLTNSRLGFPLSRAYVDDYFPPGGKEETSQLIELMRVAFQSLMDENTWMLPADLVVAKEKLDAITDFAAYPDWIMNNAELTLAYQGLDILPGQQYGNLLRLDEYDLYWSLETFRDDVTKAFDAPPTVVNAFYDVFDNSITILMGILQPPFFLHNTLSAVNYGGIGVVIGHEFTHGFDNTGRRFDKDGNYANWWSDETVDTFTELSSCFVDQYNQFSPPELDGTEYDNMTVNGQQTLGENIADNGGIREAFRAYANYVTEFGEEPSLPGLEQYTSNQLFFIGFANVWCEHRTLNSLVNQLENDPHSPGRFRVLGSVSNDADFSATWNCPVGSPMNRGPESCILW